MTSGTGGGGDVTECDYASGSNLDAVQIRYETNDTVALFMEGEASFTTNGVPHEHRDGTRQIWPIRWRLATRTRSSC